MGSFRPWSLYLRNKIFHYSLKRMLTGTQSRSERGDEATNLCDEETSWCARYTYNPNSKVVEPTVEFLRQCKFLQLVCLDFYIASSNLVLVTYEKVKVKVSRNRPGVAQRVPGGLGSQISRHSAREGGEVSLTHRPPLPPGMFLVLIFSRGWVDLRAMVRSEGNMSLKNPVTPPGIDPGTVRLVAQRPPPQAPVTYVIPITYNSIPLIRQSIIRKY
jgi:hypothetical protein